MSNRSNLKIGIVGGTGLDDPDIFEERVEKSVDTPYGKPSDVLITGRIKGVPCVLLARHGRKHTIMPSDVNYRANIWALKEEGCTHIVVTTACGSLQERMVPGDIVILDQFIDRTHKRQATFYDGKPGSPPGICHLQMDRPFCEKTRQVLIKSCQELGYKFHDKGVMITIEGPRFSSKAESVMFQSWGADLINMTTVPEVCLAKEAGVCYAAIGLPTDYDCWRDSGEVVNATMVVETIKRNGDKAKRLLLKIVPMIAEQDWTNTLQKNKELVQTSIMLP